MQYKNGIQTTTDYNKINYLNRVEKINKKSNLPQLNVSNKSPLKFQ